MPLRIGCDIVHVGKFADCLERGGQVMTEKIFYPAELADPRPEHLAGIFAAKEAVIKTGAVPVDGWREIEITWEASGRPLTRGVSDCEISISHDGEYAMAAAITW